MLTLLTKPSNLFRTISRLYISRLGWQLPGMLMAVLVLAPVGYLFLSWTQIDAELWQHLRETQLLRLVTNTLVFLVGVSVLSAIVGVSLAWLTALCDFPGRKWLDWALMLPLAIPPYVFAFVVLGILDFGGPVQQLLSAIWPDYRAVDARSTTTLILVMTAVLYPYVYLLTRNIFLMQGRTAFDVARSLGVTPLQAVWRVALPMAKPGIVAGMSLVMMEALADFGAVSVFNYDTFTTAIYKSWISLFSLTTASQLSSLLLLFVFSVILLERTTRGKGRIDQKAAKSDRFKLKGPVAFAAFAWCFLIFALAFLAPLIQLLGWAWEITLAPSSRLSSSASQFLGSTLWRLLQNTFGLAILASVLVVAVALLMNVAQRFTGKGQLISELASLGYALPGSVLAVGIVAVSAHFTSAFGLNSVLIGGIWGLIVAYMIRFFRPANSPIQSSMLRLKPELGESAQSIGVGRFRIAARIYLPMLSPGVFAAMLLVMIDVMKEMPATLMLRPSGWDTLATQIYSYTVEAEWERAAIPALILVAMSCLPVIMLICQSRVGNR